MLLVGVPLVCWGEQLWAAYPWLEPVAAVLSALVVAVMFQDSFRREAESLLRQQIMYNKLRKLKRAKKKT